MSANIGEYRHIAIFITYDDNRRRVYLGREIVAGLGNFIAPANTNPFFTENLLGFQRE